MSPRIITYPKVALDPAILALVKSMVQEEGQVIIHCLVSAPWYSEIGVRIWPTTYLYDHHSDHKSELVHFENISPFPEWKIILPGSTMIFTLFFSGLPKSCKLFDLKEEIPEQDGFEVLSINRNDTDVYYVRF